MSKILKSYGIAGSTVILGGFDLGGYGEDGGLEYEFASDIGEMTVGSLGDTVFSHNFNDLVFVNITVLESTKTYRDLFGLMNAQLLLMRQGLPILPLNWYHLDAFNGDLVKCPYPTFVQRPGPSKKKKVSERVFRLALPGAGEDMIMGALNVI